ncbi:hypothetical protein N9051_01715 [Akkermansiaceae bacterium]|nr:hypothetical protein [Akkermansiaceae bacterium]
MTHANPDSGPSLLAATDKFRLGVGVDWGIINRSADAALLQHHFDIITPRTA